MTPMCEAGRSSDHFFSRRRASPGPVKSCAGFTLVEMLVVLAIISVISGVMLLNVDFNTGDELAAATRRLTGAVARARSRAMLHRQPQTLHFSENGFRITPDPEETGRLPEGVKLVDVEVAGYDAESDEHVLRFLPSGLTAPAAVLLEEGSSTITVYIRSSSRRLVVREGHVSLTEFMEQQ